MQVGTTSGHDDETVTGLGPDRASTEAVEQTDSAASVEVMHLLAEGVPLTLLADLASPGGPQSPAILEDEGLPDVAWWEDEVHGSAGVDEGSGDAESGAEQAPPTDEQR